MPWSILYSTDMLTTLSDDVELLRMREVALVLNLSRSQVYELAAAGKLPGVIRIGNSTRVSRRMLTEWIEQTATRPVAL